MLLKDIALPTKEIAVGEGSFVVRGLSLQVVGDLLESHREQILGLFGGETDPGTLLQESPRLAARMIAHAADEPGEADKVTQLPVGVQVNALEAIWDLTIPDEETLGKVMARVAAALKKYGLAEAAQSSRDTLATTLTEGVESTTPETDGSESSAKPPSS